MSYFDEIEALCAVQAAFSDDFEYLLSPNAANYAKYINYVKEEGGRSSTLSSTSSSFYDLDVTTVTTPRLLSISTDSITNLADSYVHLNSNRSCLRSLCHINDDDIRVNHGDASIPVFVGDDTDENSFSYDDNYDTNYDSNNNNNNIRDNEVQNGTSNETDFKSPNFFSSNLSSDENFTDYNTVTKRSGTDFSWAAHVRTMCEMCGESLKLDKDRVCTDGYSPSQVNMNKIEMYENYCLFFSFLLFLL